MPAKAVRLAWVGLAILLTFFHLFRLGSLPMGLHNDEASIGYNAALIARDGTDEHGQRFPVFFKAFGEYKNPLYIYSVALLFKILPISEFTLRLASVLWFALFLTSVCLLARDLFGPKPPILIFAVLSAGFLPWFFPLSRVALEAVSQLTLTGFALLAVHRSYHRHLPSQLVWAAVAGLLIGLTVYAYSTARLLAFGTLATLIAVYFSPRFFKRNLVLSLTFLAILGPYFWFSYRHPGALTSRFRQVSYWPDPTLSLGQKAVQLATNYLHYLGPTYLTESGDATLRHHTGYQGEIYKLTAFLALVGIAWLLTTKTYSSPSRFAVFLLLNLLLAPLPAALTWGNSSLRSLLVGLYLLLLSVSGLAAVNSIPDQTLKRIFLGVSFALLSLEIAGYLRHYFTVYPAVSAGAFESYDFKRALQTAIARRPTKIIVSNRILGPAALPNFYRLIIPASGVPLVVDEPTAAQNVCIINNPYSEDILNPRHLVPRLSDRANFTKLICF